MLCVCLFPSTVKASPDSNRTINELPVIQASKIMLRKLLCVNKLRLHVKVNYSRDLLASNYARVLIKPGRATRVKGNC